MKIALSIGTRPEIIKMSPVVKELQSRNINFILIHTNQHYDVELDKVFFEELELPRPDYELHPQSLKDHSHQIGNIMIKMEEVLKKERPDLLLVQGDTNSVLASSLVASKLNIPIGHIEAGLRSYDRSMPEEVNRILTDHMSELLFAVTDKQKEILIEEGIQTDKVFIVGNTVVDVIKNCFNEDEISKALIEKLHLKQKEFILFTAHRASNVDTEDSLNEIILCLEELVIHNKVVWPIHPRTLDHLKNFNLSIPKEVLVIKPIGHKDFLSLIKCSSLVVTDSGGIQEEACVLRTPCITLRENTERPETLDLVSNKIVGRDVNKLKEAVEYFKTGSLEWSSPFGDGKSAQKIIDIIQEKIK
ncbi:UDP-N-acetylglucosamine 2-epimerase (non-hydrolyzing) [Bacteriovoracaceae bacterium]|nr:UDP-N-acetylglucosamine 2-epimerase (non-hydrolyzing) [Bacteriovoracaceae bacterium]|tara:strand:- start:55919 stop:56998 length:1080 start_codon:yes stop_codon:yes gene_type:complete